MARFAALLAFALLSALSLAQPEDAQLRKEIEAHYAKWDRMVKAANLSGAIGMIHPSFVMVNKDGGRTTYAQMRNMMTSLAKSIRNPRSKITVNQVQKQGDEVVAWVTMVGSLQMRQDGKWITMPTNGRFAETLKKINGEWKFMMAQELP